MKLMFSCRPRAACSTAAATTCKDSYFGQYKKAREEHALDCIAKGLHNAVHGKKLPVKKLPVKKFPYFPYQPQAGKDALKDSKAGGKFSEQGKRRIAQSIDGGYHSPVIFRDSLVLSGYFGAHFRFSASERFHRYFGFVHGSSVLAGSSFSSSFSFCGMKSL